MATSTSLRPEDPLATYLSDIAAQLCGPQRHRKAILAELRDGLEQATKERIAAGRRPEQAAAAAITEFRTPRGRRDAFRGELATGYARRTIASFLITGPLVGIWWLLLLDPSPWRTGLIALLPAVPIIPLIVIAIATAAGTLATTGRLMRWLPESGPRRALTATTAIALLRILSDLITMFVVSGPPTHPMAVIAIAASLTRTICGISAVRHANRIRIGGPNVR
jgi:hypothetical protein